MPAARRGTPAAAQNSVLNAYLAGHVSFDLDGRILQVTNRKTRALLAYLALIEKGIETRERLVGLLWSETEPERARASLRQAIYELKTRLDAIGFHGLISDNLTVGIDVTKLRTDVGDILAATAAGDVHPLLLEHDRLPETLLADLGTVDPTFESWIVVRREVINRKLTRDLENLLDERLSGAGDVRDAAAALLSLDPTHEKAARELMRAQAAGGDTAAALKTYKKLWDLLEDEYDVEPSIETQELVAEIKLGTPMAAMKASPSTPQSPPSSPMMGLLSPPENVQLPPGSPGLLGHNSAPQKVVVAIGNFEVGGEAGEHGYLFQAFRRELISQLVRFREWLVRDMSLSATSALAAQPDYLIEGSAVGHRGAARLILTLQNTQTGDYLWSERVPIDLASWYGAQQEIVRRLASALNIYLSAGRLGELLPEKPADLSIYDRWLRAQTRTLTWSPEKWHEAEELLKSIIEEAPTFSPAYASLASVAGNIHFYHPGVMRSNDRHQAAKRYAEQAVRIDPLDSRAHLALGWANAFVSDFESAVAYHALARDLNDSDPWTLTSVALSDVFCSDGSHALEICQNAFEISPSPSPSQWGYRSVVAFMRGKYDEAIASVQHAETIQPFGGWKAAALAGAGKKNDAARALEQFFHHAQTHWFGMGPASPEAITQWFLHLHPIKDRSSWEHLREHFEGAGAPRCSVPYFS